MSPRTNKENERIRSQTREKILEAGLKVFALRGYHAAGIGEVARTAGLSHGLVYHYFKAKEDILLELTALAFDSSLNAVRQATAAPGTAWEKIVRIVDMLYENAIGGISSYYFYLMLQNALIASSVPGLAKLMARREPEYNEILVPLITQGQKDGAVVKGDPMKLAESFWALVQGLSLAGLQYKGRKEFTSPDIMLNLLRKRSSP